MSTSLRAFRNLRNTTLTSARALSRRTNLINARNFSSAVAMPSAVPAASGTQPSRKFSALSRDTQISDAPGGFGTRKFREIDFKIVDSTLREGEQFSTAFFSTDDKIHIATQLNEIGVEYIELVTPMASKQSFEDCKKIAKLGLKAKVVTHVRCHMDDVKAAIESGVQGVNMYMATSAALRKHSHGKGIDYIIETAKEVVQYAQKFGVETRFSCEDTFRSDMSDLLRVYAAMDKLGVHRVGLADTVGVATPMQVYHTARTVRNHVSCDIEFHTHDDTGCCIANALLAIQGGVTHIDTCVLGIGERNGITPLGGFLARMYTLDKDTVRTRYNLPLLRDLELFVARKANVDIPFNNYVTGSAAFTHKAGVHSKAVMQNPSSYEVLDPRDFGVERQIQIAHRLTGWNAVKQRCIQLGLTSLSDDKIKEATQHIKNLADGRDVTTEDLDGKLREMDALARQQQGQAQHVHAPRQVQQVARA